MVLFTISSVWDSVVEALGDTEKVLIFIFAISFISIAYILVTRFFIEEDGSTNIFYYFVFSNERAPFNSDCPICLEELTEGAEGNCGHVYCVRCTRELIERRSWRSQILCPMCRQRVQLLFQYSKTSSVTPDPTLVDDINRYNNFSMRSFPQNLWDTICNMPVLLRHLIQRIMENGFQFDQILSTVLLFGGISIAYFLLPTDIFPELVFGVYGLIDDFIVVFYCLFQLSIFYRNFLANAAEA